MLHAERRPCRSLVLAFAGLVCGCSTLELEVGSPIVHQHVSAMMPGITRRGEAMAVLGTPQAVAPYGAGTVLLYEHLSLTESQFGVSLQEPVSWLYSSRVGVLFKAVMGRGAAVHEAALLVFDERGVLLTATSGDWREVVGRGAGVQSFTAVSPVVDSSSYIALPLLMNWGFDWLEPLPELQNQRYRSAVELRGTTSSAGQRALEMLP